MATDSLSGIHTTTAQSNEDLKDFIINVEGERPRIYTDSIGVATIGIGYALSSKGGSFNINTLEEEFAKAGFIMSILQKNALKTLLDNIENKITIISDVKKRVNEVNSLVDNYYKTNNSITLKTEYTKKLLENVLPIYETHVKDYIKNTSITVNSDEYLALEVCIIMECLIAQIV